MNNHPSSHDNDLDTTNIGTTHDRSDVTQPDPRERASTTTLASLDNFAGELLRYAVVPRPEHPGEAIYYSRHSQPSGLEGFSGNQQPILNTLPSISRLAAPGSVTLGTLPVRDWVPSEHIIDGQMNATLRLTVPSASRSVLAAPYELPRPGDSNNTQQDTFVYVDVQHQDPVFSYFDGAAGEGVSFRDADSSHFATIKNDYILHRQDTKQNYWRRIVDDNDPIFSTNGTIVSNCGHVRQLVIRADTGDLSTVGQGINTCARLTQFFEYPENTLNQDFELLDRKIPERDLERWTYVGQQCTFHALDCPSSGLRTATVRPLPSLSAIPNDITNAGNRYSMRAPSTYTVALTTAAQNTPFEGGRYSMRGPDTRTVATTIAAQNTFAQSYNNGQPPPSLFSSNATRPFQHDGLPSLSRSSPEAECNANDCGRLHLH